MLAKIIPGLQWLKDYGHRDFRADLVSGVTIAFMLIPQSMAYAIVAGLPPAYGLYAAALPPIIYALLGTSNKVSIGPVALDSILILSGLSMLAEPGSDHYLELAITLTLLVGIIQSIFAALKLGFISNFLSHPVILGYTCAAALVIMISQLENMVGTNTEASNALALLYQLVISFSHWNLPTVLIGIAGMLFMIYPQKLLPTLPYALILMIAGMLFTGTLNLDRFNIDVIDHVPQGLPLPAVPSLVMSDIVDLLPTAFTVALMGYVGTMSICKSQEKPTDKKTARPNQELFAVGAANLLGAFFKSFPVSASFSRSAAFRQSGAVSQVSAVISSLCIICILLFLAPLFALFPLPKALLSVIIIVSVSSMFKYRQALKIYRENKREFFILATTFCVTLLVGVQQGLLLGVALSIFMVIFNTANPHMTELGAIDGGKLYRNTTRFPNAIVRKDVLIFRFDAPLYFANKDYFVETLSTWLKTRADDPIKWVFFDAEAVNSLDVSALQMLEQLIENLKDQDIEFIITNPIGPVRDVIKNSSLHDLMSETSMFASIQDAITYIDRGINVHATDALQTNN